MILTDYQKQSRCIRWLRWWRYMPLGKVKGTIALFVWVVKGMQPLKNCDRLFTREVIWMCAIANAAYHMGHTYPIRGVLGDN